jgi:tetratricopeptide (TPR) repeat protein
VAASAAGDTAVPADLRRELAASYSRVGDLLSATGDTPGALEHRRLALGLMETLAAAAPDDVSNLRQLGVAYQKLGNSLGNPHYPNIGDTAGGLQQLERAAAVLRRATTAHPSNAMFRRNAAVIDSNIADVLLALRRPDEALARQRQALAAFEALAAADPTNVAASNDVAISFSKIGEMLDGSGRSGEAITVYQRALDIHQRMSAADPGNESLKLEVASDYNRLATAQTKLGYRAPALANHTRALEMSREALAANTDNVELKVAVALALAGRGDAHAEFARRFRLAPGRRADLANAERDYAEAVGLLEGLAREKAIDGTDLRTLDETRKALAKIRIERSS